MVGEIFSSAILNAIGYRRLSIKLNYLCLEAPRKGKASYAHVNEIVEGLRRQGWTVRLFRPSYTDAPVKPGPLLRLRSYFVVQASLLRACSKNEIIYVRAHFMALPTALVARVARIPIVQEVNGTYQDFFITYPRLRPFQRALEAVQRMQFRWADLLLPVTEGLAEWARRESGHDRVEVMTNGANTELFRPRAAGGEGALPYPYVVFVGSLAAWHGARLMLDAVSDGNWPEDVRLVVVGEGPQGHRIVSAARDGRQIVYLGHRPYEAVPALVKSALAGLVLIIDPAGRSRTGVMPLKLFESLACGVPAIVTDLPGQADLVRNHRCGLVVSVDDGRELARAVAWIAANPEEARRMGARGARLIRREHSWQRRAEQISELLKALRVRPCD